MDQEQAICPEEPRSCSTLWVMSKYSAFSECGPRADNPRASLRKCVPSSSLSWEWWLPVVCVLPFRNRLEPQNRGKAGQGNSSIFDVSFVSPPYCMLCYVVSLFLVLF